MRMRLAEKNIKFVKEFVQNGITFCWFVSMMSGKNSDARDFINYENGKSVFGEYTADRLPKSVQKFIAKHNKEVFRDVCGVKEFIYR